jgi:hypothetical protein
MILLVFDGRSFGHYSFRSHELYRQDVAMARGNGVAQYWSASVFFRNNRVRFFKLTPLV